MSNSWESICLLLIRVKPTGQEGSALYSSDAELRSSRSFTAAVKREACALALKTFRLSWDLPKHLEIASIIRDKEVKRISQLKEHFLKGLLKIRPNVKVNPATIEVPAGEQHPSAALLKSDGKSVEFQKSSKGLSAAAHLQNSHLKTSQSLQVSLGLNELQSPHILNVSIPGIENEVFVLRLDAGGVACSTKSSCLRDADESYVLKAIGADSKTSIRFSFGRWTKKSDLDKALAVIEKTIEVRPI